jgi:hypothetical protein
MNKCPACREGYHMVFSKKCPLLKCDICNGTGELPENIKYDEYAGKVLTTERLAQQKTLREFCLENDIDVVERSRNERGYFNK